MLIEYICSVYWRIISNCNDVSFPLPPSCCGNLDGHSDNKNSAWGGSREDSRSLSKSPQTCQSSFSCLEPKPGFGLKSWRHALSRSHGASNQCFLYTPHSCPKASRFKQAWSQLQSSLPLGTLLTASWLHLHAASRFPAPGWFLPSFPLLLWANLELPCAACYPRCICLA